MRFAVIYPLIALFIFARLIWPAFGSTKARALLTLVVVPGALFPAVVRFFGGSMVAPVLPQAVMIVGGFLQDVTFCVFALLLIREILSIPARILGVPLPAFGRSRALASAILVLGVFGAGLGLYQACGALAVHHVDVRVRNLDPRLEGMKIVQLSDLHVSSVFRSPRVQKIVDAVNAQKADLIVITGDIVDGTPETFGADLAALRELKAPLGVWGCEGNHEHYVDYEGWKAFLPKVGVNMLYNEHRTLEMNGAPVVVAGMVDLNGYLRFGREKPDAQKTFSGAPQKALRVLLLHQPKVAPRVEGRADLILSGHTHGGQVFLLHPIVSKLNDGFVKGLYRLAHDAALYVSPGTDVWNGFLLRLGTTGEVTVLTLKSGSPEASGE